MNILCYIQPHRGGGIARHSIEMINGLAGRADAHCTLFASRQEVNRHASFMRTFAGIPLQQHRLPAKWLERSWKMVGWPPLADRCRGFDLIYCPAEVRLPRCGIPSIVTVHDVQALEQDLPWSQTAAHQSFRHKWLRWLPKVMREASRIVTVSEFSRQRMIELLGADPARVVVVGNGVSSAFFRPASAHSRPPLPAIVVIGGLRLKKGAEATLAVARELHRRGSPLTIEVYGLHDREWAARASEHPNLRLHGYLDDTHLAERLSSSTALLFLSPYEGFGIPALEAMAAGTPAVVANAGALPEVVGDAGLVVDADDPQACADLLDQLGSDTDFRDAIVAKGRKRAQLFTWHACVERLAAAMRETVSSAHRGRRSSGA